MKPFLTTLIALLHLSPAFSEKGGTSTKIDRLWKARGLQAQEKYKLLSKKEFSGGTITKKERCELILENAYSRFAAPQKIDKIVKRSNPLEGSDYFLLFHIDEDIRAQVVFIYSKDAETPNRMSIRQIDGDKIQGQIQRSTPGTLLLTTKECLFELSLDSPLEGEVQTL